MYSLGTKIKFARKKKGLKQIGLAKAVKITQAALSEFELDKSVPRDSTLLSIAKVVEDDFGIEWLKESMAYKPKLTLEELTFLVHEWLQDSDLSLNLFVIGLAKLSKHFRELLDDQKFKNIHYHLEDFGEDFGDESEKAEFVSDLGNIDEFDVEEAVREYKTADEILEAWYVFENRAMPEGFQINFGGWKELSDERKVSVIRDVKNAADNLNQEIDSGKIKYE